MLPSITATYCTCSAYQSVPYCLIQDILVHCSESILVVAMSAIDDVKGSGGAIHCWDANCLGSIAWEKGRPDI